MKNNLKKKKVACTIASKNYLYYLRSVSESFLKSNPDTEFYILLVDEVADDFDIENEPCEIILAKDIGIENFESVSFKYDVLEFNTSMKYSFLKYLKREKGADRVMYIDPDIYIYRNLDFLFDKLDDYSMIFTPHTMTPYTDDKGPGEADLLRGGTLNLGWIAVGDSEESDKFLDWAERFVLKYGYNEPRSGLFTDQKPMDLVSSYFDNYLIYKDLGCNMAYWNSHERTLSEKEDGYYVNDDHPLHFYHFSGLNLFSDTEISKFQSRYDLISRPDLYKIFNDYRANLLSKGYEEVKGFKYAYNNYSNGEKITSMARKLYAANLDKFEGVNPFDVDSGFYEWAKERNLLDDSPDVPGQSSASLDQSDKKLKSINFVLRMALKFLGANKYSALMKYMSYISVERNQKNIIN